MVSSSDNWVIDLHDVRKVYRRRIHALCGVRMQVQRGEIFGLLGPNGAGKSTLVKIMMSIVRPTKVEGTVLGRPVGDKAALARLGYLPENHRFPRYLTGRQILHFYGAMAGADRSTVRRRTGELLDLVDMTEWANRRIGEYSKGMLQRIGLAQALVHDPDIIVLDEPTDGVDPVGRRDIRDCLIRLRGEGKTIFLNSHLLSELEMICTRVAILVKGEVVSQGTIDELTDDQRYYEIEIALDSTASDADAAGSALLKGVADAPLVADLDVSIHGHALRVNTHEPEAIQPLLDELRKRQAVIRAVRPHRPSLEDLFMAAVTDSATGTAMTPGAGRGPTPTPARPPAPATPATPATPARPAPPTGGDA